MTRYCSTQYTGRRPDRGAENVIQCSACTVVPSARPYRQSTGPRSRRAHAAIDVHAKMNKATPALAQLPSPTFRLKLRRKALGNSGMFICLRANDERRPKFFVNCKKLRETAKFFNSADSWRRRRSRPADRYVFLFHSLVNKAVCRFYASCGGQSAAAAALLVL